VDAAYYDEISGRLRGLLIRLQDRLPAADIGIVADLIDHNELGLALEHMAETLGEEGVSILAAERQDMLALAMQMQMGDGVPMALSSCPTRA
jgi:hypothetical protein